MKGEGGGSADFIPTLDPGRKAEGMYVLLFVRIWGLFLLVVCCSCVMWIFRGSTTNTFIYNRLNSS